MIIFLSLIMSISQAATIEQSMQTISQSKDFVAIHPSACVAVELRYASDKNFLHRNLYGPFRTAYLHRLAAEKFFLASKQLCKEFPGAKLLIYDALRPRSVQRVLWDAVKGTDQEAFIANPEKGSNHNFGFAIDLSILDAQGRPVDMGTDFDDFTDLAQPRHEPELLADGRLTQTQVNHRRHLRQIMTDAGFIQLPHEWWHYDALPKASVLANYKIVE